MTTTNATELSVRRGFTARRNSRIQARKDHKLGKRSSPADARIAATVHDQSLPQLTHDASTTTTTTTTTTTATCCIRLNAQQSIYSPMSSANYLVLAAIILVLTASCPSNTNALPRRMTGRHLILPHRHHVHLRSAANSLPQRKVDCKMSSLNVTHQNLTEANDVLKTTKAEIDTFFLRILDKKHMTKEEASNFLSLQNLDLTHPLVEEVNTQNYTGHNAMSLDVELPKISEALIILFDLLTNVTNDIETAAALKPDLGNITTRVEHNMSKSLEMRRLPYSAFRNPQYTFNKHIWMPYAAVDETLKVLNVIEKKYDNLIRTFDC